MVLETDRLTLREYVTEDFDALFEIVSDIETMQHYPAPFDEDKTRSWIQWNLDNYKKCGFGLWAVVLKETGEFIGDCGITIQDIDGEMLPEIGYHIHKKYWRKGFAKEAARAVRDWVFLNTQYDIIYSYMKYTNVGSYSTALANGMKKVKEYQDGLDIPQLIEKENVETPEYVTVSVNDEFIEKADFEKALIDGDEVEFLYFMGGGR